MSDAYTPNPAVTAPASAYLPTHAVTAPASAYHAVTAPASAYLPTQAVTTPASAYLPTPAVTGPAYQPPPTLRERQVTSTNRHPLLTRPVEQFVQVPIRQDSVIKRVGSVTSVPVSSVQQVLYLARKEWGGGYHKP